VAQQQVVPVRCPPHVTAWLDDAAARAGVSRSDLVRAALQRGLPAGAWPDTQQAAGTALAAEALQEWDARGAA
jgi:metal-responsive CopG/Arc/MetJ family transcriptional regulator